MTAQSKHDPQLISEIEGCAEGAVVYALLVLETGATEAALSEASVAALIAAVRGRAAGELRVIQRFPQAGALLVAGERSTLTALIAEACVLVASATKLGLFPTAYGHHVLDASCQPSRIVASGTLSHRGDTCSRRGTTCCSVSPPERTVSG